MSPSSSRVRRTRSSVLVSALALGVAVSMPGVAVAHKLDHPAPAFSESAPLSSTANSGGKEAQWELVGTVPTGNPQTDLDFFTSGGESYAAVGTLAAGANAGGQSIIQLTKDGEVDPSFFSAHPSASCVSNPAAALGLQHDVEVTPKTPGVINNSAQQPPAAASAQLLLDATDAAGRCHDQGALGLAGPPRGGLEIVDITDVENPVEIGLTSHIGQAHTVNVDPRRPNIAYVVTSDAIGVVMNDNGTPDDPSDDFRQRNNERDTTTATGARNPDVFDLDGFEVVDLSSCMTAPYGTLPAGATVEQKRASCRPETYRYRYPTLDMSLGHTLTNDIYGCHELEVYPDDRLTCGSGAALIVLDMSGAFDDNGTPTNFLDDKPKGQPLECFARPTTSATTKTGASITDCVRGGPVGTKDLSVPAWLQDGAPSLTGVEWLGSVYHAGRAGTGQTTFPVTEDIDFNHEAEFTRSGKNLLATDERGGGVTPPGATCDVGDRNAQGNGGIHAYQVDELRKERPETAEEAHEAYARGTDGAKAIFRAPIRTGAEGTFCTAHVMQQIPGQNRIFMGWYTQGTQVVDYVELPGGKLEWVEDAPASTEEGKEQAATEQAGWFIPEKANTWVSHVFRVDDNEDGTFTYYGATGDFNLGTAGRNAIDVYKVTLPAPATACDLAPEAAFKDRGAAREVHRESIDCVAHYGIAQGTDPFTYGPTGDVTREQMASFLVRAVEAAGAGSKLPAERADSAFSDIAGSRHRAAITRLADAGVLRGTGGSRYSPQETVTRQQMATFIVNTAELITGQDYTAASTANFRDIAPGNVHLQNINAGFEAGLFSGTGPGTFSPVPTVARDQMATFLSRLFEQTIQP